jgi:hypothetical protein
MKKMTSNNSRFVKPPAVVNHQIDKQEQTKSSNDRVSSSNNNYTNTNFEQAKRAEFSKKETQITDPGKIASAIREAFVLPEMQEGDKSLILKDYYSAKKNLEKALSRRPENPYIKKMIEYTKLKEEESEYHEINQITNIDSLYSNDRLHEVIDNAEQLISSHFENRFARQKAYEYLYKCNLYNNQEKAEEYYLKQKQIQNEINNIENTRQF